MTGEQERVVRECAELSAAGRIHFGEVVGRLVEAGIERYHADYTRWEMSFYTPEGGSCVVAMGDGRAEAAKVFSAEVFSASGVEAAVRQAQRGEIVFQEFTRLVLAAGCVGYFVLLSGKRVQYFGRRGEMHTEWFPGAKRE